MTDAAPSMQSPNAIRTIAIAGGGTAGWMAAAVLSRALPRHVSITLIESEEIGTVGVGEATIPQIKLLNQFLGLDEDAFLKATNGAFKLGIEFRDWGRKGDAYMHAFGDIGMPLGPTPFHHFWLRHRALNRGNAGAGDLWSYSINAVAARQGKFDRVQRLGQSPLNGPAYAFHFDAGLYARELRRLAEAQGVKRCEGRIVDVEHDGATGRISSLRLKDDALIAADFFIDCTGFRGLLIGDALDVTYEDWTRWLPCDRAVAAPCAHGDQLRPYTQATARNAGWQWRIPLQSRVGNGHVFCSAHMSEDEATQILLDNLEGEALAEPRVLKFTTGMRQQVWRKNCVALGLSSGFMEPLESTSIHLIQSCVSRLMSMFPDRNFDQTLIDEFNRQTTFEFERIRDFLILHYVATERDDSAFWRDCCAMELPETLRTKMDLFAATGRIFREHEELFTEPGWLQVMTGQGITPRAWHPMADVLSPEKLNGFLNDLETLIAQSAAQMPSHNDFIARNCAA